MGDGRPDRDLYERVRNEVQQEFAHLHREKDMKDDYAAFTKVKTKEEARTVRAGLRGELLFCFLFIGLAGLAIAYLW
ncbi:MAG: hypothetical protein BGO06_01175 [Shinella sp. 65-6]|jgi:hypothetical protein|nr:MAG: hypothetical protein BGO06_01175 [Shinella sp. 65-6]